MTDLPRGAQVALQADLEALQARMAKVEAALAQTPKPVPAPAPKPEPKPEPAPAPAPQPVPAPAPAPPPQPVGALSALITLPGQAPILFDIAAGKDMGSYVAPTAGFTQRCIRVRNPALPNFPVDFRADASGDRVEVVFWNGEVDPVNLTVKSGFVRDLPGYQVTITKDGATIYSATVPTHYWATRWRYQSAPRPVIRSAAQIFSDKFFPNMSRKAARLDATTVIKPLPVPAVGTYKPFMPADKPDYKLGILQNIETGGERLELGAMTEWAADYLLNGTPGSLNAIRQHAEMASSEWPFFLPDLNTGAALNFKQDAKRYHTFIGDASRPYGGYYLAAFTNRSNGWEFHETDTHFQMHPYIAYALTEDAYFLEGIQFLQAYGVGNIGTMLGREGMWANINGPCTNCSYYNEIRAVGNGIRNLAMAYRSAPANPPSWLLPQSYYGALSSDYSAVINKLWTANPAPLHATFRQLSFDPYFQAFEQAYALMGMAIADLVGMPTGNAPSWLAQLTFYFGMFDAITNGTSGWNNQCPQPHDILNNASPENPAGGAVNFANYKTWGDLYKALEPFLKKGATFPNAPSPGNQQGGSMGNCSMILAACAMAQSRGVPPAANAKAWMDKFIDANYPNNSDASMGIAFEMKCGFDGN